MTSLIDFEDFLDPSDNLVGGWIGWLVQVDDAVLFEDFNGSVGWRVATGEWCEV